MRKIPIIAAALAIWPMLLLSGHAQETACIESFRVQDPDTALLACTRIIEAGQASKTDLAAARANRAILYLNKGDLEAADRDTVEALALDGDHAPSHVARAAVLARKGFADRALVEVSAAIKLDPKNDRAYNYRGVVEDHIAQIAGEDAIRVGDLIVTDSVSWRSRAIGDFSQAISLNPNEPNYYFNRASVLAQDGQFAQAIPDADKVKEMAPDQPGNWNQACWLRAIWGQELQIALADCDKALVMVPANAHFMDSRCLVKFRMEKYAEAIEDCTTALGIFPRLAGSLYVRGLARMKSGQAGVDDVAAAERIQSNISDEYAYYGVKP